MNHELNGRTAVYRLFDASGALLYVGMAVHPRTRWRAHALEKPWWSQVADRTVEWHDTRAEAAEAEYQAIVAEDPRHNVVRDRRRFHLIKPAKRRAWVPLPGQPLDSLEKVELPAIFSELSVLAAEPDPIQRAKNLGTALAAIPDLQKWLRRAREHAAGEMHDSGMSYADIGAELGMDRVRAHQIAKGKTSGRPPKPKPSPTESDGP